VSKNRTTCPIIIVLATVACGQVVNVETPTVAPTTAATPSVSPATIAALPTVTRAMPTAPPPNTPTVSPTPTVHVVQTGETLIAIALQYGVSVAALQTANGITDPSTLQVSQELIIPTGEESKGESLALLLPTPTPVAFAIEGLECYEEPLGSLWCVGDVVNSTESSIENVQLRVTLYDDVGQELMSGEVFAALDLILSGQRAPFGARFTSLPGEYQFRATPIRAELSSEPANRFATLEVSQVEAGPAGSLFEVSGSIANPGQRAVTSVTVVVTTYDAEGKLTGFRQSRLPDQLPAGASVDFAVSLLPYNGVPANYSVALQGLLANP
jgi:LysM repeat protein